MKTIQDFIEKYLPEQDSEITDHEKLLKSIEGFIEQQELIESNSISIVWCVDDVLHQAKDDGIECTEAEALEILQKMDKEQDANYGITWDTISYHLDNLKFEKKKAEAESKK